MNGQSVFPVQVTSGGNMSISGISVENNCRNGGTVVLSYTDYSGTEKEAKISCNGGATLPIAWYKFDEGSGATTKDSSGNNNGTLLPPASGPTWQTTGCASGKCIIFDGTDDYINAGNSTTLNPTSALTVMAWANIKDTTGNAGVVCRDPSNYKYLIYRGSGGSAYSFYVTTASGTTYTYGTPSLGLCV